jgi:MFS family permease
MSKHDPYAALRFPEFRYFILTRFLTTIALQIQAVVVSWKIYELTKNPLSLGLIGLSEAIPALSVALYAGYVVDKNDRRKVVFASLFLLFICSAALFLSTAYSFTGLVSLMYAIIFISGIARGFLAPSIFTLMAQIVPREIYANSTTWNSSSWQIGAVAGPAIGGLMYGLFGATITLSVTVALLLISLFCVMAIKSKGIPIVEKRERMIDSLTEGIRFVFSNKIMLGALTLDLFAVLFGGAVALLPIFAKDILLTGPMGLGILRAAPSVGAFATMITMAYFPPMKNAGRNLLLCVAGFGVCMILFGLSTNFFLSIIILVLSGAFDSISVIVRSTIIQTMTPDNMRGRVSAVNAMFIGSSNEIGAFESGITAKWLGTVPSVVFGGAMTLFVVAYTSFKAPLLKKFSMEGIK